MDDADSYKMSRIWSSTSCIDLSPGDNPTRERSQKKLLITRNILILVAVIATNMRLR